MASVSLFDFSYTNDQINFRLWHVPQSFHFISPPGIGIRGGVDDDVSWVYVGVNQFMKSLLIPELVAEWVFGI